MMRELREWLHRLWATFRPARADEDLEEELRLHLELVADEARRRGDDPGQAVRRARLEAGGAQAMEALRDQRGLPWLADAGRDLVFALRTLRRRPGFTATAMLSLALGIGANTGIFSLVDQVLLRQLAVYEPERLVRLQWDGFTAARQEIGDGIVMSYPACRDLQTQARFFADVFCRAEGQLNLSTGGQYEVVGAELVSGSYFSALGLRAERGRLLGPGDDQRPGEHPVVVLSHDYWQNRLAGAENVVGRTVLINRHRMTVIGVAPPAFRGMNLTAPATVWLPAMMADEAAVTNRILDRYATWMHAFARLQPGVTAAQAEAGLRPWFSALLDAESRRDTFPRVTPDGRREYLDSTIVVEPAAQGWSPTRGTLARPMTLLMAGTLVLLLLACLNVASLLLARGAERSQELTTRMALGASRGRVARQLIVESLVIAAAGGLLGLAAAPAVSRVLLLFMPQGADLAPLLDVRIFAFAVAVTVAAGVLCGVAPAWQAARRPLAASINSRSPGSGAPVLLRKLIVGAQLALTLVLLSGAALFVQTLTRLYGRDRGFDSGQLVMFRADPAGTGSAQADAPQVMRELRESLEQAPGVERVSLANNALLGSLGPSRVLTVDAGRRVVTDGLVPMLRIGAGYFSTLGVTLLAGREFEERDTLEIDRTGFRAMIVNESFARRYFGDVNPVGRRVGIGDAPDTPLNIEIVGVVADYRRRFLRDDADPEHFFVPFAAAGPVAGDGTFFVRVRGEPEAAMASIRAAVARVDPTLPLINLTTVEDQVTRMLRSEVMLATLSSGFGGVALLLSVVGLFGVMSFVVTQRTQEIGMRMALGATRLSAVWLIVRDALLTIGAGAGAGILIGVAVGAMAANWLSTVLYGVSVTDVRTFGATAALLTLVPLTACLIPAGRAAVMSPMMAIREQSESQWRNARVAVRRAVRELAAPAERAAAGTVTTDVAGAIHRAASFPEAVQDALATLRQRAGASLVVLLEKHPDGWYRAAHAATDLRIPADGVLVNRLRHYPHPLALMAGDFATWMEWAAQVRPDRAVEIADLARTGARVAVPLRTTDELVGVLLLAPPDGVDEFSPAQRQVLAAAADVFALLIQNARLNDRALEQEKLRRDVALAAEVQRRLLPAQPPRSDRAAFAAFTLPARTVGGDYYDFIDDEDGRIGIAVADIAGKGVAAALLMSAVQASLRVLASRHDLRPSELAAQMNRFLHRSTASNGYATFFFAQLDAAAGKLRYVNAGHNPPYLVRGVRLQPDHVEVIELSAGGTVLGLFPEIVYQDGEVDIRPGDLLVAYTDGVPDARNVAGDEFGEDRLKALLRGAVGRSADAIAAELADAVRQWIAGAEQHDDVTFVVATVCES